MRSPLFSCFLIVTAFSLWGGAGCGGIRAEPLPRVEPEDVGLSSDRLDDIDGVVRGMIEKKQLAGAVVAVARRGKIAYLRAFGDRNAATSEPMEEDTIFRIYSMTKAVVTAAGLLLVEEGKLGLDAPVADYFPELEGVKVADGERQVTPRRPMTVRDLMRHTSGLTYGIFGDTEVDRAYREAKVLDGTLPEMVEKLAGLPLLYHPGERWVYSVASDVLGRLVEVVSEQSLEAFLEDRFFAPLGMKDTGFYVPEEKASRLAATHGPALILLDDPKSSAYLKPPKMVSGGGGLVSTTRDYLRFLQMIANGGEFQGRRYLKEETVGWMTHDQLPDTIPHISLGDQQRPGVGFGLGFSVRTGSSEWDSEARIGEYGWGGAASTHYWISPDDDLVVVTMEQTMPFNFALEFGLKGLIYSAVEEE